MSERQSDNEKGQPYLKPCGIIIDPWGCGFTAEIFISTNIYILAFEPPQFISLTKIKALNLKLWFSVQRYCTLVSYFSLSRACRPDFDFDCNGCMMA